MAAQRYCGVCGHRDQIGQPFNWSSKRETNFLQGLVWPRPFTSARGPVTTGTLPA